jgi:hypothetical protein
MRRSHARLFGVPSSQKGGAQIALKTSTCIWNALNTRNMTHGKMWVTPWRVISKQRTTSLCFELHNNMIVFVANWGRTAEMKNGIPRTFPPYWNVRT